MTTNNHIYVKIAKDNNTNLYNVILTKTYDDVFLIHHENVEKIPFVFKSADIAKDFVSMLPDKIEKASLSKYKCSYCHLCKATYETYKLSIGEYEVYIVWDNIKRHNGGILSDKVTLKSSEMHLVRFFAASISPEDSRGYDITYHNGREKLTDLINKIKSDKNELESQKEEYNFELVQQ